MFMNFLDHAKIKSFFIIIDKKRLAHGNNSGICNNHNMKKMLDNFEKKIMDKRKRNKCRKKKNNLKKSEWHGFMETMKIEKIDDRKNGKNSEKQEMGQH